MDNYTTIQATSKKYKAHMLLGGAVFVVGVFMSFSGQPLGALILLIGLVWFVAARALAWWNNG